MPTDPQTPEAVEQEIRQHADERLLAVGVPPWMLLGWADTLKAVREERDEARKNYQFMVERAADQKLAGYRELGARAAKAENAADDLREQLATLEGLVRDYLTAKGMTAQLNAFHALDAYPLTETKETM